MAGAEHALVFSRRGETVTATLDGRPLPVKVSGPSRKGTLHFGAVGGVLRINAIDYRSPR